MAHRLASPIALPASPGTRRKGNVFRKPRQTRQVLHIVRSLEVGGLERLVADMVRHRGFDCTKIACLCTDGAFAEPLRDAGATVMTYTGQDTRIERLAWLKNTVQNLRPDVVHCHGLYSFLFGGLIARWCRISGLVLTKHGQAIPNTPLVRWICPWLLKRATVICVSPDIRDRMKAKYRHSLCAAHYIRNGIDLSAFRSEADKSTLRCMTGLPADAVILGSVGRLTREKGFDVLLEAIKKVERIEARLLLVIVGDGPCRVDLHKQVSNLNLNDRVLLLGERHDVPDLLASFDGFVLASRSEGQPLSVIEAMASGLPVIATTAGGIPSMIEDGVSGVLVPPDDSLALSGAISEFLRCNDDFQLLGERAQTIVQCEFSMQSMLAAYEDVYETAVTNS